MNVVYVCACVFACVRVSALCLREERGGHIFDIVCCKYISPCRTVYAESGYTVSS